VKKIGMVNMIKKFKKFENVHSDIDPYDEEVWDENIVLQRGRGPNRRAEGVVIQRPARI
jgi:hypothetical protein